MGGELEEEGRLSLGRVKEVLLLPWLWQLFPKWVTIFYRKKKQEEGPETSAALFMKRCTNSPAYI